MQKKKFVYNPQIVLHLLSTRFIHRLFLYLISYIGAEAAKVFETSREKVVYILSLFNDVNAVRLREFRQIWNVLMFLILLRAQ